MVRRDEPLSGTGAAGAAHAHEARDAGDSRTSVAGNAFDAIGKLVGDAGAALGDVRRRANEALDSEAGQRALAAGRVIIESAGDVVRDAGNVVVDKTIPAMQEVGKVAAEEMRPVVRDVMDKAGAAVGDVAEKVAQPGSLTRKAAGAALVAAGIPMLVLPGPGVAAIAAGAAMMRGGERVKGDAAARDDDARPGSTPDDGTSGANPGTRNSPGE
ncbi:hypothetical protein I3I95_03845 [bacterium]|nr:hypothetical protein [bacterium]